METRRKAEKQTPPLLRVLTTVFFCAAATASTSAFWLLALPTHLQHQRDDTWVDRRGLIISSVMHADRLDKVDHLFSWARSLVVDARVGDRRVVAGPGVCVAQQPDMCRLDNTR